MHALQCIVLVEELLNFDSLLCVHFVDGVHLCRMQITRIIMAVISTAHTLLPNTAPNIMNMVLLGRLEVGDVGSVSLGVICDMPPGLDAGEDTKDGTENEGEVEGVVEDVGSGAEDEGEPEGESEGESESESEGESEGESESESEGESEGGAKTDQENSSAVKLQHLNF